MSDGKQRNSKSVLHEISSYFHNEDIEDKLVQRRVYALDKKKGILEQKSRGNYRIKEEYSKEIIDEKLRDNDVF